MPSNADLEKKIDDLQRVVEEFKKDTETLIEAFKAIEGLVKVILFIGKIAKPVVIVAGTITAVTMYLKGVRIPSII